MKSYPQKALLVGIMIAAALLRFVQLGVVPASPDWDEAAIGYNAYSILKTGRDEYGAFLPAAFRSFDDYKPPLYEYLAVVPVWLFGLDVWVVRLPAAIMGTLGVLGVYFLVKGLLALAEDRPRERWKYLPLLATLCLALSPWHIHFSRIAFEAIVGVTFNIWFVVCFLKGLRSWKWLVPAAVLAGLSLYTYHSERVFVPLLTLFLALYFRKKLFAHRLKLILPCLLGLFVCIPLVIVFSNPRSLARYAETSSILKSTDLLTQTIAKINRDEAIGNRIGRYLFDNSRVVYVKTVLSGYLAHFSLQWLFLSGDNNRHHAPDMGLLYVLDFPFLLIGLYYLLRRSVFLSIILFGWFFIAPIAAAPSVELPHAVRTLVFLPTFQVFIGIGLAETLRWMADRKRVVSQGCMLLVIGLYALNLGYYLHMYYIHMDQAYSSDWQHGYQEAVDYVKANGAAYQQIIVSPKLGQPYIFFLFYLRYDPAQYLSQGGSEVGRQAFDRYRFQSFDWANAPHDPQRLYIGTPDEITGSALMLIKNLDGSDAIKIAVK